MSRTSAVLRRPPDGDGSPVTSNTHSDRLATIEVTLSAIQQTLEVQLTRIGQMQAQIDLLVAKDRKH
jgi:hypothetical protein